MNCSVIFQDAFACSPRHPFTLNNVSGESRSSVNGAPAVKAVLFALKTIISMLWAIEIIAPRPALMGEDDVGHELYRDTPGTEYNGTGTVLYPAFAVR